MAIKAAVAGTQYERAWKINNTLTQSDNVNILTVDSEEWQIKTSSPVCVFRRNAIYLPHLETIVVDVQAAARIVEHVAEPENLNINAVISWIIGHELGHAVLRHRRSAFFAFDESQCEPSTMKRAIKLFSPWFWCCRDIQMLELEADKFFASQILKGGYDPTSFLVDLLLPLLGSYPENPDPVQLSNGSHPDHTVRAIRLIEHLACDPQTVEDLRKELIAFLDLIRTESGKGIAFVPNSMLPGTTTESAFKLPCE